MQLATVLLLAALGSVTWGERSDAKTRVGGIDLAAEASIWGDGFQAPERTWENFAATTNSRRAVHSLGFTGHQFDPETGLVYARARYYDPDLGVVLSRDALDREPGDAPNLHRFAWARMNPLRFYDPSGFADEAIQAPQMVPDEDESRLPTYVNTPETREAERRAKAEDEQRERDKRLAGFEAQNLACAKNPEAKGCRYEGSIATESSEGPGTVQENDDPGVGEALHRYEPGFAKVRTYAKTGREFTEAGMAALPGASGLYYLKLDADEARQGNWKPALIRAGILLGPGVVVAVAKVAGKWVAKAVKVEAAEAKVAAKEAAAAEEAAVKAEKAGWQKYEERFGGKQTPMETTVEGQKVRVRLDKPPSATGITDFKYYDWSNPRYSDAFIQDRVLDKFSQQIRTYKTIRPDVHFQFSQDPPAWVVERLRREGATYSVVP